MSDLDVIKPSYDALNALKRDIDALSYLSSVVPSEDEHQALLAIISESLESHYALAYKEVIRLWDNPPGLKSVSG